MLRVVSIVLCLGFLASCGVDGEPVTPTMTATVGVGSGGVHTSGRVGVTKGPLSISVGGGCSHYNCW